MELLEEAVDLLRRAPASAWAWYLAGAAPFFGGALIFWSQMTGVTAAPDPLPWALALALLFGWRQYSRAYFGGELYRLLAGGSAARHSFTALAAAWSAGLLRIPLLIVPFATLIALFRNVSVLATRSGSVGAAFSRSGALAARGRSQAPALLTVAGASFVLWVNVFTGMVALPFLMQLFTGQSTVLTRSARALFNGPMMLSSLMLTWCLVDAVLTAFYALRVFYGESEETGADLLVSWRRALAKVAAVLLLVCLIPAVRAESKPDLNHALDQVLREPAYQWRQPLPPEKQNAFVRWTDHLFESIGDSMRWLQRKWAEFVDWLRNQTPPAPKKGNAPPPALGLRALSWIAIAILAGALVALLLRAKVSRSRAGEAVPVPAGPVAIDLEDPSVLASQLPEAEWIALARDYMARGDYRMALRAYFLGNLAFLASKEMVAIGRSKTNLDYLRELRRRSRAIRGLDGLFGAGIQAFESAWYGLHEVGGSDVAQFAENFERMRSLIPA
jgi:hypothetical protein